ncbi:dihydrolipoamide acetyltransferase family protein [Deinococcus sonorensis]|uniref:Dihydrolipoamide acetyltransferase component of pyruvate dehydrogenase complex n=2 Tax=Deinococcus sonorensis TaxID=309891 RepID=A0AAU7UCF1_9DEIO
MTTQSPALQAFTLPSLAESVVEGEILGWLVAEGDTLQEGQSVLEVMTDKVNVELPAPFAGVLRQRLVQAGDVVAVGATLALIEPQTPAQARPEPVAAPAAPVSQPAAEGLKEERSIIESAGAADVDPLLAASVFAGWSLPAAAEVPEPAPASAPRLTPQEPVRSRVLAAPSARQLARERGVDLTQVPGSGPNGTVRRADVAAHLEQQVRAPAGPTPERGSWPPPPPPAYRTPAGYEAQEERTPFRGQRRAISQALLASTLYTAQTHTIEELDCSALIALRGAMRADAEAQGVSLSYLPFFLKAVAVALHDFPALNSSLDEARGEVVRKRFVHLGMAVNAPQGLIVPVLRDVDRKSLLTLARESSDLAERARAGTLQPQELQDATFTVSNIGAVGALVGVPIVNPPASGILSLHSITKRPVAVEQDGEDVVVVRPMMYLTLSFDHRLVDGADAARFNRRVVALLEEPRRLMLSM